MVRDLLSKISDFAYGIFNESNKIHVCLHLFLCNIGRGINKKKSTSFDFQAFRKVVKMVTYVSLVEKANVLACRTDAPTSRADVSASRSE